jgi:(p)ppGpp synthase/HD superfamily hydrolase
VSGRTKDYIAAPKPNGYQSLHSTLLLESPPIDSSSSGGSAGSSSGNPVVLSYLELQVRTAAMHAAAEGGDASHSGYKGRLERRQVRSTGLRQL